MKNAILAILCCVLLNACCQKAECPYYVEKSLVFRNFSAQELDTVMVVRYEANTNFQNIIDSVMTKAIEDTESQYLPYSMLPLSGDYAFKVYLPSIAHSYFIGNFGFKKVKDCNSCFPARPKSAYTEEFNSYVLDGKTMTGKFITIEK